MLNSADAPPNSAPERWLIAILVLALALRVCWCMSRPATEASLAALPDQREYLECARNLLHEHALYFVDPRFDEPVYAFRTPGYPFFLAACGAKITAIRLAQCVLETLTVLAAYVLARRFLSTYASLLAALIVAVDPFLIYFTSLILTETLFTAMLAWGLVLLIVRSGRWWIAGALLLVLSILVRPGAIASPVVLALVAAIVNRHNPRPYHRWRLPVGATALLLTLLILLPWAFRNDRVVGRWIWTSTNDGFTLYDGFNPDAAGASDQRFVQRMPQLHSMNEVARNEYLTTAASRFIGDHPARSVELMLAKLARTWSPQPLSAEFARPSYVLVAWLFALPLYVLILVSLGYGTLPQSAKFFLLVPAIYLSLAAMFSVGSLRYRIPAAVPLAVLAAAGAQRLYGRFTQESLFRRVSDKPLDPSSHETPQAR